MDWLTQIQIIGEVFLAMVLGGVIGLERELAKKPAGLRTHMLVAGAAAFLVILGDIMFAHFASQTPAQTAATDPIRIIQAIVVGISFLGAGTIIQRRQEERIEGLTTAASILFTSAIGIAVALDEIILATGVTLLVVIINYFLKFIRKLLKTKSEDS